MSSFYVFHLIPLQVNRSQSSSIVPGSNSKSNMVLMMMMMMMMMIIIIWSHKYFIVRNRRNIMKFLPDIFWSCKMQLSSPIALLYTRWLGEGMQGHSSIRPSCNVSSSSVTVLKAIFSKSHFYQRCAHLLFRGRAINPLNAELNPICHLLVVLGAHLILHISRISVKE